MILLYIAVQPVMGQLIIEGQNATDYDICTKWQSLNNFDKVLEFNKEGIYKAYTKGESQIDLHYEIIARENGLIDIDLLFGVEDAEPGKVTIQIVDSDRIRIYVWKHGDVLDLADEYHRTNDFDSMNKYLKKIRKENN